METEQAKKVVADASVEATKLFEHIKELPSEVQLTIPNLLTKQVLANIYTKYRPREDVPPVQDIRRVTELIALAISTTRQLLETIVPQYRAAKELQVVAEFLAAKEKEE